MREIQPGILEDSKKLYTKTDLEEPVYGEELVDYSGSTYRRWDPNRSKIGSAVKKGIDLEIHEDDTLLYLGAASGTTVSHVSEIASEGFVFAVEYSKTTVRDLVSLAERKDNIAPILGDAREPDEYGGMIDEVDVLFQDISQKDQADIFLRNADRFLRENGLGLIAVKAHSISSTRNEEEIYDEVRDKLSKEFRIIDSTTLEPYENSHLFLKMRKSE